MPIKNAEIGGIEVSVEVEYPVYYIIRHKEMDAEPIAFIVVENEKGDVGFPNEVVIFLRKNFKITKTTQAEAETYDAMGVAPIFDPVELANWLVKLNMDIDQVIRNKTMMERLNEKVDANGHTYDLNPDISHNDLKD